MIRQALSTDIPAMLQLAAAKRQEYEGYAATFWRRAEDATEKQSGFFEFQLTRPNTMCLVSEEAGEIDGFLIAGIVPAPPVYDPGSLVCTIDDFTVEDPTLWVTTGKQLLAEARSLARAQGANLTVVVCGQLDEPKREMLQAEGLYVASEWFVSP